MSNQPTPQQDKDVDLIELFNYFGKGFKKIGKGLGDLFKWLFHTFMLFLLFVKKWVLLFLICVIAGGIFGSVREYTQEVLYKSYMKVAPNYGSSFQLASRVSYLNNLTKQKQWEALAQELKTDTSVVKNITQIQIYTAMSDNEIMREYNDMIKETDTAVLKYITYPNYQAAKEFDNYGRYSIEIESKTPDVMPFVRSNIIKIEDTPSIEEERNATNKALAFKINSLEQRMKETDTLIESFNEVYLRDSQSTAGSGTNIFMADNPGAKTNGIDLIRLKGQLTFELEKALSERERKKATVTIIAGNLNRGQIVTHSYKTNYAIYGAILALLIAAGITFWKYLNDYEKKHVKA